jgi:hypothetical protein
MTSHSPTSGAADRGCPGGQRSHDGRPGQGLVLDLAGVDKLGAAAAAGLAAQAGRARWFEAWMSAAQAGGSSGGPAVRGKVGRTTG